MSEHYFSENPSAKHKPRTVSIRVFGAVYEMRTDAGVFSGDGLDPGSRLLMESLPALSGNVADLGCGWGAMGIPLALHNPQAAFYLTDINERAAALARENVRQNRVPNARVFQGDGLSAVSESFQTILTNPPIRTGKQVVYRLFQEAFDALVPGGRLYAVIRKQQGAPSAIKYLETLFSGVRVIERGGGYWVIEGTKEEA